MLLDSRQAGRIPALTASARTVRFDLVPTRPGARARRCGQRSPRPSPPFSVRSGLGECQNLPLVDLVDFRKGFVLTGVKYRAVFE